MLVLIKQVGINFAVIDTDDGVIEWVDKNILIDLVFNKGISINGVTRDGFKPREVIINYELCNWNNGNNIFQTRGMLFLNNNSNTFKFKAGKKTYSGRFEYKDANSVIVKFSFNVMTCVPRNLWQ